MVRYWRTSSRRTPTITYADEDETGLDDAEALSDDEAQQVEDRLRSLGYL